MLKRCGFGCSKSGKSVVSFLSPFQNQKHRSKTKWNALNMEVWKYADPFYKLSGESGRNSKKSAGDIFSAN